MTISSFLSLLIARKKISRFKFFFFTFGLRYLEDRSGVEVATKMFVVSTFAKKNVDDFLFPLSYKNQKGSLYYISKCFSEVQEHRDRILLDEGLNYLVEVLDVLSRYSFRNVLHPVVAFSGFFRKQFVFRISPCR